MFRLNLKQATRLRWCRVAQGRPGRSHHRLQQLDETQRRRAQVVVNSDSAKRVGDQRTLLKVAFAAHPFAAGIEQIRPVALQCSHTLVGSKPVSEPSERPLPRLCSRSSSHLRDVLLQLPAYVAEGRLDIKRGEFFDSCEPCLGITELTGEHLLADLKGCGGLWRTIFTDLATKIGAHQQGVPHELLQVVTAVEVIRQIL